MLRQFGVVVKDVRGLGLVLEDRREEVDFPEQGEDRKVPVHVRKILPFLKENSRPNR
jgi:hypothetical protein